ncbi:MULTISPECIES: hypothetical protein [unclassified Methylobacterium]|uniref:hypothetical protein n=1 Tax=unclassified Methylobacterium TaxID=2615210 RepID=UPI00226AE8E9|nr:MULTISPECIES: hypothetical protein [unclassified Methylobacterium]
MTADLLTFPRLRKHKLEADSVRLGFDFSQWCAELYRDERFLRRVYFDTLDDARAEVERIQANGLRRLPDAQPYWTDVAYGELSGGRFIDDPEDAA